jgi:hypothetical protein
MKLHCNENCYQYVINLSSGTNSILTHSEGLSEKTEEQVSAPPYIMFHHKLLNRGVYIKSY